MLIIYLIIGAFTGLMSGLFGVSGGVIVIPTLSNAFRYYGVIPNNFTMQMAIGTSLAIMIFTASSALYAHHKKGFVRWDMFRKMVLGLVSGSIVGALIAHFLPSSYLQFIFGIFLFYVGVQLIFKKEKKVAKKSTSLSFVRISAFLIGIFSSLLGVGGGTLLIPFFLKCQFDIREATATSVACGLLIGVVATISFMIAASYSSIKYVNWSTGYIYWPAFLGVVIPSVLLAPIGATLSHKLPKELLKRAFGLLLLLLALDMLFFK